MIIRDLHIRLSHAKMKRLLHNLRASDHVLKPRATIKRVHRLCFQCKQDGSQPQCPLMRPLPASRLTTHRWPFTHVDWVDYFGLTTLAHYMFLCCEDPKTLGCNDYV